MSGYVNQYGQQVMQVLQGMAIQLINKGISIGGKKLLQDWQRSMYRNDPFNDIWLAFELADDLVLDFSDWKPDHLNLNTTSRLFGIPNGKLRSRGSHGSVVLVDCQNVGAGSVVVKVYQWCRRKAPQVGDQQRTFRFKKGKYVGPASSGLGKWIGAGLVVGAVAAVLS